VHLRLRAETGFCNHIAGDEAAPQHERDVVSAAFADRNVRQRARLRNGIRIFQGWGDLAFSIESHSHVL
jgi:hypothetical protein